MSDSKITQLVSRVLESGCTVEAACRESPELVAEVRERLRRVRSMDAELDGLFPEADSEPAPDERESRSIEELPRVPGHEVLSVLGRGGMGVVYRARHSMLHRDVAIKMLLRGAHFDRTGLKRLLREAEAIAALRHPNIVQVYEVGEIDGLPYFTMELVEGGNLRERLEASIPGAREAAALVSTLAEAMQVAHERGIVHRDLKPANVLLASDGTPKIADFGLALRMEGESSLTLSDARPGTPSYMAPEQAQGGSHTVGPGTDIYALGALLYATLTGRPPFRSDVGAMTLLQVIRDEPVRPSRLNPRVPRDVETICLKCLSKDPTRRYPTAAALAADLQRFLRGEPILARPISAFERILKWIRRRPAPATIVAGSALAVLSLVGAGVWFGLKRSAIERAVNEDFREVDRAAAVSNWPAVRTAVERAGARLADGGSAELLDKVDRGKRELAFVERLDAIRLQRLDVPYKNTKRRDNSAVAAAYEQAFSAFGMADVPGHPREIAARVQGSRIRAVLVSALDTWATSVTGDDARRDGLLETVRLADPDPTGWRDSVRDPANWKDEKALAELANAAPISTESVMLLLALAEHLVVAGGNAVPFLEKIQREHPNDFWANSTLGIRLAETSSDPTNTAPIRYFQAAVAVRPDDAFSRANLGSALGASGQLEEAEVQLRKALVVDPDNVQAHLNLSTCLKSRGRLDEAIQELRTLKRLEPDEAGTGERRFIMEWLIDLGRLDEAIAEGREAVRFDPRSFELHLRLGYALHAAGHLEESCEMFRKAIAIDSRYEAHEMLALALDDMGRIDDSIASLREAVRLDPHQALVRNELMNALIARGKIADARTQATLLIEDLAANDPRLPEANSLLHLCELIQQLETELPAILDGTRVPKDVPECLAFADLFRGKRDYRAATRYYAEAFDRFGSSSWSWRTLDAARCAALAAATGDDATEGARAEERTAWRSRALEWLRVGLRTFDGGLTSGKPRSKLDVQWSVMEIEADPAFTQLRDAAWLARLPEDERAPWQALWSDADALLARAKSAQ